MSAHSSRRAADPSRKAADPFPKAGASPAVIGALQAALSAENAAIFGYGVAGAHLTGAQRAAAERDWVAHETARDTVTVMLLSLGSSPVPAAAAYGLPFGVHDAAAAAALAAFLEDRVTRAYLGLVALREPRLREFGARAVQSAALRATAWRGYTLAFPGLDIPAPTVSQASTSHGQARPPRGQASTSHG